MIREFIPYQQSLELKELGFDEPCYKMSEHRKICNEQEQPGGCQLHNIHCSYPDCTIDKDITPIGLPLYQQSFRWFRENYNLFFDNLQYVNNEWKFTTYSTTTEDYFQSDYYKTYEESELECLKKLIEIVKNK